VQKSLMFMLPDHLPSGNQKATGCAGNRSLAIALPVNGNLILKSDTDVDKIGSKVF